MEKKFIDYLENIGLTKLYSERVIKIYNFYQENCPELIEDIFITDYITEEGLREYENLWFFSANYIMEAKGFIKNDDLDIDVLTGNVVSWRLMKDKFDLKEEPTDQSRMNLIVSLNRRSYCDLKASRENCQYLVEIFNRYVKPNFESTTNVLIHDLIKER